MQMEISEARGDRLLERVEYERLAAEGYFNDERVELLFGRVTSMSPVGRAHGKSVWRVGTRLERALGGRAEVLVQTSWPASDISMPEPDVYVFPRDQDSWTEYPTRALLVVEVADSSLSRDRNLKRELYAQADVEEYWIVDLVHGCIEAYRDRRDGRWETLATYHRGETVAMRAFPDVALPVDDVVPPLTT